MEDNGYHEYEAEYQRQWVQVRLNMSEAVMSVLHHFTNTWGRASRSEYWWWMLFATVIVTGVDMLVQRTGLAFLALIPVVLLIYPTVAVTIRRLHDTERSAWWLLMLLLPIIGWGWLLGLLCMPSDAGENDYGDEPNLVRTDLL